MIDRKPTSKIRIAGGMPLARIILVALLLQFPFACAASTHSSVVTPQTSQPSRVLRIGDAVVGVKASNELVGIGIVLELQGNGDGCDFLPTHRALTALLNRFDFYTPVEPYAIDSNNYALVSLSMLIPPGGAHAGERLDIKVSALAAKSLKGGCLAYVPLFTARGDAKIALASAGGPLILSDEKHPTEAVTAERGVLIQDVLPDEINDNTVTFIIQASPASYELAVAIADRINEEAVPETGGHYVALVEDATSVRVAIPKIERAHRTPFIARLLTLPLPRRIEGEPVDRFLDDDVAHWPAER
ncbi:MAG TPA: flagellar basal body P-ring protein FlgI [Phycisphaerae bacterium]|jgi:flagellar basal body P-ring protein FlgI